MALDEILRGYQPLPNPALLFHSHPEFLIPVPPMKMRWPSTGTKHETAFLLKNTT